MTLCSYSSLSCHILLPRTDCCVYFFHWTSYNLFLIFCKKIYVDEIQIRCDWVINYDVTSNKLRLGDKLWCYLHCALLCACRLPARHWAPHPRLPPPPIVSCSHWAAHPILPPQPSLLGPTQDQGWIPSSIISQSLNASIQWWWDCSSLPFPGHQSKNRMQNMIIQRRQVEPTLSVVLQKQVRLNEADDISFPILSHICTLYIILYSFWYICFVLIYNPWSYMYIKHMPLPFTMKGNF